MVSFIEFHRQRFVDIGRKAALAMEQLSQEDLNWRPNPESNSIANLVFHMDGNLRSRVGEGIGRVPFQRDRDGEFNANADYAPEELLRLWNEAFSEADRIIAALTEDRLSETTQAYGKTITLAETLVATLSHGSEHVGQIIYVAKMRLGPKFRGLTTPHKRRES